MLRLPKNLPPSIQEQFERCVSDRSFRNVLLGLAEAVRSLFVAEEVVVGFLQEPISRREQTEFFVSASLREGVPSTYCDELVAKWQESGIHQSVTPELRKRLAPVSYSAYSWPFPNTMYGSSVESETRYAFPREYTLLIPFTSELIVTANGDPEFFGYFAVMFDRFPRLVDDALQLIVILPGLLSEISAAYQRDL